MNDNSNKWKSRLLSSSIPLEFEVAKVLANLKFAVSYDYSYMRQDGKESKEFSADVLGTVYFPLGNDNQIDSTLTLLAECKYRDEGKKWIFVPDVNNPDFSDLTIGYTIRTIGEFSTKKVKSDAFYKFEEKCNYSLKGTEVNMATGDVFDKDIKHGIQQLKFALPYLLKDLIENNLYGHIEDSEPKFILPILITNADLYLLNNEFSISTLKSIDNIEDISKKVPYLIMYSNIGPDFTSHHKTVFKEFYEESKDSENLEKFESKQEKFKDRKFKFYSSPIETCHELQESHRWRLLKYYSQYMVCSFESFESLIKEILTLIPKSIKK